MRPIALAAIAAALLMALACTSTEPESSGGIFGDRPIETPEEEDDAGSQDDAATDVGSKDTGADRDDVVPDASDDT